MDAVAINEALYIRAVERRRETARQHYAENREKKLEQAKKYYWDNREAILEKYKFKQQQMVACERCGKMIAVKTKWAHDNKTKCGLGIKNKSQE